MRKIQQTLALLFILLTTIVSAQERTLTIKGKVYDKDTQNGVDKAEVRLYNEAATVLKTVITNAQGQYQLELQSGVDRFKVAAQADNYNQAEVLVTKTQQEAIVDFGLNREEEPLVKASLPMVFFDFDSSYLTAKAKEELKQIVTFLEENKTVRLRVNAHTDSRGSNPYNDWLSKRRGQRVINWLVQQGVEANRLEGHHFGKTQLSNDCTEGTRCSAEQHRENRRCSFEIIR